MKKNEYVPKDLKDKRYFKNYKSVKKLCKILELQLIGFNPDWLVNPLGCPSLCSKNIDINDGLMGRFATLFGLSWEFDFTKEKIKSTIKDNESYMLYVKNWGKQLKSESIKKEKDFLFDGYKDMKEKIKGDIKKLKLELEIRKKRIKDTTIIKEK